MAKKKAEKKSDGRNDLLLKVMGDINKKTKKDMISFASDHDPKERLPFGIEHLDEFIGGGIVCGNFHILYGSEGSGKSSAVYSLIAENQRQGKVCCLVDMEHNFEEAWVKSFGVNLKDLVLIENCETAEEAMDVVRKLSENKVVDLIVVDSIQGMAPKGSIYNKTGSERSIEDDEMALLARKMGKFITTTSGFIHNGRVALLLIGQTRTGGLGSFITRDVCTGGKAKDFFSVLTVRMRKGAKADAPVEKYKNFFVDEETGKQRYKTESRIIGFETVFKIEKMKISNCSPEGSELRIPFYFDSAYKEREVEDDI